MADIQNIVIKYTSDTQGITDAEKAYEALTVAEKKATDQVKKLEEQQTELGKARKQVAELSASHERLAQSIKKAQEANNPTAVKSATQAYQELGKKLETAKQKYGELANKANEAKNKTEEVTQSTSELSSTLASLASYVTAAFSIGAVINFGKQIYDNTLKMEGLNKRLGMLGDASTEFQYLVDLSNRFGLDLESTADAFSSFAIASTASGLSLAETKKMFEGVSTAITAMQLPAEQSSRVFYALQQMLSKGKVSAEELRQQMGEALPGSFALAVQASGKTEQEFNKLLETGQILAKDFVPKFAEMLGAKYEGSLAQSLDTATASTNRLSTSWTLLLNSLGNTDIIKNVNKTLTGAIDSWTKVFTSNKDLGMQAGAQELSKIMKQVGDDSVALQNKITEVAKGYADALARVQELRKKPAMGREIAREQYEAEKLKAIYNGLSKYRIDVLKQDEKAKEGANQKQVQLSEAEIKAQKLANDAIIAEQKRKAQEFQKYQDQINEAYLATTMQNDIKENIKLINASAGAEGNKNDDSVLHQAFIGDRDKFIADAAQTAQDAAKASGDAFLDQMEKNQQAIEASKDMLIGLSIQSVGFINELFANASNAEIKHIEELNAKKVISDQEANRRILAEKRKMFIADKIASATEVGINTLVAISKVGADLGVFGIPLAALVAAQGALAVASILAKPMPFAKGTKSVPDINGQPHKDSVPALLQPREKVFPVSTSTLYEPALDAIFDRRVSPDVANAIARGDNGKKVVVVNDNKEIVRAIKNKETVIINDRALQRAVAYENQNTISRNKRRFHVAR